MKRKHSVVVQVNGKIKIAQHSLSVCMFVHVKFAILIESLQSPTDKSGSGLGTRLTIAMNVAELTLVLHFLAI